ncbi:calcium-related spray protein [Ilyonectria robusta]
MQRDMDTLTPLDARNSLLLDRKQDGDNINMFPMSSSLKEKESQRSLYHDQYSDAEEGHRQNLSASPPYQRTLTPLDGNDASQGLIQSAAPVGWSNQAPNAAGMGRYDNYGGYNNSNRQSYGYAKGGGYRGF